MEQKYIDELECINKRKSYIEDKLEAHRIATKRYFAKISPSKKKERYEKQRAWYANKVEKIICSCGGCYSTYKHSQHQNTKKHQDFIQAQTAHL